jgi:hypothetical protein
MNRTCSTQGEMRNICGSILLVGKCQWKRLPGKYLDIDTRKIFKFTIEEESVIHCTGFKISVQ